MHKLKYAIEPQKNMNFHDPFRKMGPYHLRPRRWVSAHAEA